MHETQLKGVCGPFSTWKVHPVFLIGAGHHIQSTVSIHGFHSFVKMKFKDFQGHFSAYSKISNCKNLWKLHGFCPWVAQYKHKLTIDYKKSVSL
jgi:hypothetical protein